MDEIKINTLNSGFSFLKAQFIQFFLLILQIRFFSLCIYMYKDYVTNEEVRAKIQQAMGPHEDLTIVKRRKLRWYGHVFHSSGLAKTILQDTVKGGRRQSRQRKRWQGNIREWTGLEIAKTQRAVEKREKWRKLVAEPSLV